MSIDELIRELLAAKEIVGGQANVEVTGAYASTTDNIVEVQANNGYVQIITDLMSG